MKWRVQYSTETSYFNFHLEMLKVEVYMFLHESVTDLDLGWRRFLFQASLKDGYYKDTL